MDSFFLFLNATLSLILLSPLHEWNENPLHFFILVDWIVKGIKVQIVI